MRLHMRQRSRRHGNVRRIALLSVLSLPIALVVTSGGAAVAPIATAGAQIASSSLGTYFPTFVGSAATGCASGCSLLSGPFSTPQASATSSGVPVATGGTDKPDVAAKVLARFHALPSPAISRSGPDPAPPTVSCQPRGAGCDTISSSSGGATGVKGLNAVDSGTLSTNPNGDLEPSDQGLCAGNGYVVENNNLGEVLIFNTALQRKSAVISMDTMMGLTSRNWSSGGDISCTYDYGNGGHWFFTEFPSRGASQQPLVAATRV
jgi:hypothetical protein